MITKRINDIPENLIAVVKDETPKSTVEEQRKGAIFIAVLFGVFWLGINYKAYKGKI